MNRFFSMDNKFFQVMGRIADLIILNLVFLVCCIPIITIGPALTALHYVTLKMARNEESYILRSFFKSFKQNFRQGLIINLILLATAAILYVDFRLIPVIGGTTAKVLQYLLMVLAFLFAMMYMYIYPVLAKFYNPITAVLKNSLLMAIRHLPYTILEMIVTALPFGILLIPNLQIQATLLMLFILMGGALIAFINGRFFAKIFDNYIPKEEEEETSPNLPDAENPS